MKHADIIQKLNLEQKCALLSGETVFTTRALPGKGIPAITLSDGPNGVRKQAGAADHLGLNPSVPATCFPTSSATACSWDEKLGEAVGEALGEEAAAQEVAVLLGPGLNVQRSPLCGRDFEYFSEDPILAGRMAAAYVRGIQKNGISACPKHFAVNSQELRRMASDSVLDERTLRELYLTGFEIVVKEAKPKTIMTSYNLINGTYANENAHLLQDILRKDWGFDGAVVTDWGGSNDHARELYLTLEIAKADHGRQRTPENAHLLQDILRKDWGATGPSSSTGAAPFEYFSEDPILAGRMAAAYVRGIQKNGISACPKHFAVNSQELRRMASDSVLDERTLRELYLTGFEIVVKEAKPKTIMTSYNLINGTYANENAHLLQDILRKDWGFDGAVVTDWGGSNDHALGVKNGSTLEMPCPGGDSIRELMKAVQDGRISEADVDARLDEMLELVLSTHAAVEKAPRTFDAAAHHKLARRAAAESIVLLRNEGGILPLTLSTPCRWTPCWTASRPTTAASPSWAMPPVSSVRVQLTPRSWKRLWPLQRRLTPFCSASASMSCGRVKVLTALT